ncbi:hypothetical protein L3X39_00410 [Sabulilitoribacter multivorans]|uniref:Anti-sigma factor n=1 Tax=Flaviramulus multivorans TaxID=1304750 RepID=A0ABS9IE78_9FLAO|nr:hypothetical protein [Flaviramulus multivorans]MCF7559082.1 hypothetical protein [Flaviramulus multivorans]
MAPLKYEEQLKEKLEKRRLEPSSDAWEKLSTRLDENETKNNKPYWWLGIAASIIGVLFVISQFLSHETSLEVTPKVVTPDVIQQENPIKVVSEDLNTAESDMKEANKEILKPSKSGTLLKTNTVEESKVAVVEESEILKDHGAVITPKSLPKESLTFEQQKINEVVAQVQALKNKSNVVTDADIDALLEQAQKEVRLHKLINETTGVVDADALLQDVEADLDQSFRSKVFEAVKSSYNSVKTAVAQRNN